MKTSQRFWRGFFFLFMIAALCVGLALPIAEGIPARAAPQMRASANIVISEFRTRGPGSASNEFIELHNISSNTIAVAGWQINYSTSTGTTSNRYTFPAGSTFTPGQYFLLANSSGYPGSSTTPDATYTSDLADNGGIAILNSSGTVIDQVGMSSGSAYRETTVLTPMSADNEQSYERKLAGNNCNDTDDNTADFVLNASSSNPQNSSSTFLCLGVTSVNSPTPDGSYNVGANITIEVTFNMNVDVMGSPTLLLETGVTDRNATYISGSGTDTLMFNYTVMATDASADLDYASSNALSLNGGSIVGPPGNAVLTLSTPGSPGSLGANKNIVIDNGSNPIVSSITRQSPVAALTNADTLVFRVTFSEAVFNVDTSDFVATGTTGTPSAMVVRSSSVYDLTISGGDLTGFNGTVGLGLSATQNITDASGNNLATTPPPSPNETYTVDNSAPTVTINQSSSQVDPTAVLPVSFDVVFSEEIIPTTFTLSDITQNGTAVGITWNIVDSGNHRNFTLSATSLVLNGTLIPTIAANRVTDLAGNNNLASTSTDNTVTFADTTPPTVTVNQSSGQSDPATTLPVRFTVIFSEVINTGDFVASDITQNGTATGITWSITDSGNHRTFTLSVTAIAGAGTLIPSIAANQVRDLGGNSNIASTSTDNTVTFNSIVSPSVVISEFRTRGPNGSNDEFIELYNPTANYVDISGWKINGSNETGTAISTRATIPASTILRSGQHYLVANNNSSGGFSGSIVVDLRYTSGIADGGGIALIRGNTIIDAVGMGIGSAYREGTVLAPLTGTTNQSYERALGGLSDSCQDTNNNSSDFSNISPSDPQNSSTVPLRRCGVITSATIGTTITTITAHTPSPSLVKESVKVSVRVVGGTTSLSPLGTKVNISGASGANIDCTIALNASGTGSCNVTFNSAGTKTITATYLGDNTHSSSKATVSHSVVTATPTKFKTRTPTPAPPPPLVGINEFVPRPGHDWNLDGVINTGDEYIELINHGVVDVNLSGYSLDDEVNIGSEPFRLPAVTIKPGERIVFYGSQTGLLLGDGGDGVRLLKPTGQLADAYNYSVVRFPDESYCRLPDNGGLDDWNEFCFPTPGLQNSLSESSVNPPISGEESLCPVSDTLPEAFVFAECEPFGSNIWNRDYWDRNGWFDEKELPEGPGKSPPFAD